MLSRIAGGRRADVTSDRNGFPGNRHTIWIERLRHQGSGSQEKDVAGRCKVRAPVGPLDYRRSDWRIKRCNRDAPVFLPCASGRVQKMAAVRQKRREPMRVLRTRRVEFRHFAKPCLLLRRSGKRHCTPSERTESCRHGPRHLRVNRAAHRLAFVAALLRRPRLSSASPARKIRANRLSGDQKGKSRPQCRGAVALRSHQRANPEDRLPSSIGILLEATGDDAIEPEQSLVPRFLARHDRPANPA